MIVVFITPTAVYLGADSLMISFNGDQRKRRLICKVKNVGDCYYTAEGISRIEELNFDAFSLAETACMQPGSLAERARYYDAKAYPQVARGYSVGARSASIITRNNMAVVFARIENGEPQIQIVNYWRDGNGVLQRRMGSFRGRDAVGRDLSVTLGVQDAFQKEKNIHPTTYSAGPPVITVERWLRAEIKDTLKKPLNEQYVGAPISLVEITSGGGRWIHQGVCTVPTVKPKRVSGRPSP